MDLPFPFSDKCIGDRRFRDNFYSYSPNPENTTNPS